MVLTTTLPGGFLLQCDVCQHVGNEAEGHAHARETGHAVFTVIPD